MNALAMMVWDIDRVLFRLGPVQVRTYSLCMLITVALGFFFMQRDLRRRGYSFELAQQFFVYAIVGFIVGARLVHCYAYHPAHYLAHPLHVLRIWKGGIASHGAAIGLIAAALCFARVHKLPFLLVADALSFPAAVGASFVRIGNFFNSEIVGRVTTVPWAVQFARRDAAWRHPSQLYEAAGGLAVLIMLLVLSRRRPDARPGFLAGSFMTVYFTFRFIVEFFKERHALQGPLTMGQYLSIPFAVAGVLILVGTRRPA